MGKQFLDSEILNYTIKNLVSQIDKTFLKKNVLFNVIIIDNDSIHKINKEYRNIDRETDVISF